VVVASDNQAGYVITRIEPRVNYVLRKATRAGVNNQILCSNIDQAIFLATLKQPFTALGYIDRFLVMLEAFHVPAILIFNKIDLLTDKDLDKLDDYQAIYQSVGYPVQVLSTLEPAFHPQVVELLKDKTSFIAGPSGTGKSSFINFAEPNSKARTGDIMRHSQKGRHTTTFAEWYPLSFGGAIIDAPGFKEFTITGIARNELSGYFPEMRDVLHGCKFNNCTHTNEPDCAVRAAVEADEIPLTRYHTYLSMLEQLA
jgi:ribosome biogenesis GTPase